MDFQLRFTEAALADFTEIVEYSWMNFPDTAQRTAIGILNQIALLTKFPYLGTLVLGRRSVRQLVHTPFVIFYRVHDRPNVVEILHIRHASRDRSDD